MNRGLFRTAALKCRTITTQEATIATSSELAMAAIMTEEHAKRLVSCLTSAMAPRPGGRITKFKTGKKRTDTAKWASCTIILGLRSNRLSPTFLASPRPRHVPKLKRKARRRLRGRVAYIWGKKSFIPVGVLARWKPRKRETYTDTAEGLFRFCRPIRQPGNQPAQSLPVTPPVRYQSFEPNTGFAARVWRACRAVCWRHRPTARLEVRDVW
ncbi:hypothetical protein N657DRAFT_468827 [Parathielavia appendiculata]|uniref:Uncharacterized protein n=1 Tax=Parathielavia appendiculata TaxID=2587402 RepID=A0AAN6Z2L6_9PEZI|nr:hypothetical protein N657DRAFT_468827 [Parathielavia appendiculata]